MAEISVKDAKEFYDTCPSIKAYGKWYFEQGYYAAIEEIGEQLTERCGQEFAERYLAQLPHDVNAAYKGAYKK